MENTKNFIKVKVELLTQLVIIFVNTNIVFSYNYKTLLFIMSQRQ
jgi:hypothetical protein